MKFDDDSAEFGYVAISEPYLVRALSPLPALEASIQLDVRI